MQERAFNGRHTFLILIYSLIVIYYIHVRQYKHVLDEYDHANQQNPPFPKLHIELLEQFEGSRTFTKFINPCFQKTELNNHGLRLCMVPLSP
jgi:hypothetical protein